MPTISGTRVKVATEVWLAVALLQHENPMAPDFSIEEILDRATREQIAGPIRPGVYVHIIQHCVANRPPNPAKHRMLFETRPGRRRLFRKGDNYHPARRDFKVAPDPSEIPSKYSGLLDWYRDWSAGTATSIFEADPLLALAGSGHDVWADEPADEYVRRLREGWE